MPIVPIIVVPMIAIATAFLAAILPAAAQPWPNRPMTMVVPFAAGGASDVIARILAQGLRTELGQSVVVENVSGAGGMVGSSRVAKAAPDGYQMMLGNVGTHAQNQSLYKKPLYHAATDFEPVALVTDQSLVLVVRKDFPADSLQRFIAYTKTNQAKLQYGSSGVGGSNHLACLLLNSAIGIEVTHIPYRSGAQAMQDMIGGRVDYQCPSAPVALPQIEARTVKALAILSKNRSSGMPDLPSAHEQGLTDFDIPTWYALFLPGGAPAEVVQRLNRATVAALKTPLVQQRLKEIGSDLVTPERMSPEYLGNFVASELEKWARVIAASGIQLE
jgi:tripartite-type tricarboxylate transporter receptor subunit TctC